VSDELFFTISKVLWALLAPGSIIVLLILGAWITQLAGRQKLTRRLLTLCTLLLVLISSLPMGEWMLAPLEGRFPANSALPADAEGVIVLGGAIDPERSEYWQQAELTEAGERITAFVYLANLYPQAQLIYSGGNAALGGSELKEADYAPYLLAQLGLDEERALLFESESRNTWENVVNSQALVGRSAAGPQQDWIIITSAFHMPRAIGAFCRRDWPVYAYAVDHRSNPEPFWRLQFAPLHNLQQLELAIREWLGLIAYRITGRTDRLLAGNNNHCASEQESTASVTE